MKEISKLFVIFLLLASPTVNAADELYFIDAHSQVDHEVDDLGLIIERMNKYGVRKTILASRGKRNPYDIAAFADRNRDRIIAAVRSKSGKYKKNKDKYYPWLNKQLDDERFNAVAEVLLYHAQKGDRADEVSVYPDDRRVQVILQRAVMNKWPFVMHIEFAALDGSARKIFMRNMTALLQQYPRHPFLLIHMGQLDIDEAEPLLKSYPNFHLITSHADPITVNHSSQPWTNMFAGDKLKTGWQRLMISYPRQFVFALDNVWADHWQNTYGQHMDLWRSALLELPDNVAHAIAHGNAERLWQF